MNQILSPKQRVSLASSGLGCEVQEFLGGGGQGEVYRADVAGKAIALKWYFAHQATAHQRNGLEMLIEKGPPNDKFLWPADLATAEGVSGFGYVMPLREPRYKGIMDMMKRRIEPKFRALATAGMELADSYFQLHARGLCYRDISFGNVFFDPDSGHVLICDNDNVTVNGSPSGGVLGTPRFMAPEVVRGDELPSTTTDRFSLAVLLFYMYTLHHPLEGKKESAIKCFDQPAQTELYGKKPLFIFHPTDHSNEPDPQYHQVVLNFWPIYPKFLRDLFTRAFTEGIQDPVNGRVVETVWRSAMVKLRDSIVYCSHCAAENFYDSDALKANGGKPEPCWNCKKDFQLPARIRIGKGTVVMLNYDAQIFPHHVDDDRNYDFRQPVAVVTQHPTDKNRWGLKNVSAAKWVITPADGRMQDVEPGRTVPLAVGTKIQFGKLEGEIRI